MNRLVAVLLAVAVPATALADKPSLLPSYEQSMALTPAPDVQAVQPLYTRWWVWTIAGAVLTALALTTAILVATAPGQTPTLMQNQFKCSGMTACDGWVNQPPQ